MIEPTESSYLKYLPAIFQQPDGDKLLSAFLSPFEQVLSEFEILLSGIDHYFDPRNTPEQFLPWLASWVALELDDKWDQEKKRVQIAKAIDLYRRRGTVEGLKQSIAVYDPDLQVSVVEQAMLGGMQIGVASRIGRFDKGNLSGECMLVQQVERKEPVYYDYYVVEPGAQPDRAGQDDPIRFYYRTDHVDWVRKGQSDDKENYVWLKLTTGEVRYHEPATVSRLHAVADTRYSLTVDDTTCQFVGDTLLLDHAEDPFQFMVDIGIPTGWLFRFHMDIFDSKQPFLEQTLVKAIGELLDANVIKIEPDKSGRKWKVTTKGGECNVERTGWALHMDGKPSEAPMLMLQVHDINFEAVCFTLQQKLVAQGMPFPSDPKPWWEPESHQWLMIGDANKPPAYLAVRTGSRLSVYQFVGDAKWRGVGGVAETHKLAEDGGQLHSEPPDVSRAIHAIVDDVKPSHTQYTLRFRPKAGPARLPPLPIEKRFIARLRKLTMPQADDPVHVPEDLKDELAKHNILLSDSSTVRNESKKLWRIDDSEKLWRIDDGDAYPLYITTRPDETLDVFQCSLIDETLIIG